jgi:hypothetical protein
MVHETAIRAEEAHVNVFPICCSASPMLLQV